MNALSSLAHSKLGASSMYRWAACPGSVALSAGVVSKSSADADTGSDAHALAARCLEKDEAPQFYIGKLCDMGGRSFTPDREMADAVQVYLDAVRESVGYDGVLHVETRFDLSRVHPGCFGTSDAVVWKPAEQLLIVFDYKHGAGIPVYPEQNPQLKYYGLGALLNHGYAAKVVRLVIVQPRCGDAANAVRPWELDTIDLVDFAAELTGYAVKTEEAEAAYNSARLIQEIGQGFIKEYLSPGDHCRFCPGAKRVNGCPALTATKNEMAKLEFSPALSYNPDDLRRALDSRPAIQAWLKNLDEFAYAEAQGGRTPPGYKLVAKRAIRKWRNPVNVVDFLKGNEIDLLTCMYPPELLSPAQLEKVVGRKLLDDFILTESSGSALVPESDKRPAVKLGACDEFTKAPLITDAN